MKEPTNTMNTGRVWVMMVLLVVAVRPVVAGSQGDQPTLDELLKITPREKAATPDSRGDDRSTPQVAPEVSRALSGSAPGDVFNQAVQQMEQAADRLDQYRDVGLKTQRLQQDIIAKLDQVIAMARQQQSQSGSSGSSGSSGQAQQQQGGSARNTSQRKAGGSQAAAGQGASPGGASPANGRETAGQPDSAMQSNRTEWGNLPARLRDELQQGINERFSSIYREMTGAYYRRLAEQGE